MNLEITCQSERCPAWTLNSTQMTTKAAATNDHIPVLQRQSHNHDDHDDDSKPNTRYNKKHNNDYQHNHDKPLIPAATQQPSSDNVSNSSAVDTATTEAQQLQQEWGIIPNYPSLLHYCIATSAIPTSSRNLSNDHAHRHQSH